MYVKRFQTREKKIYFKIKVKCKMALLDDNISEIIEKGSRRLKDSKLIGKNGIDIKESITNEQKNTIINEINKLTRKSPEYCIENDIIQLSGHIIEDYCISNPDILTSRLARGRG